MTSPLTSPYEQKALRELAHWQRRMQAKPGIMSRVSSGMQRRINDLIPEKVHAAITSAFKVVTGFLLTGSDFLTREPLADASLELREEKVRRAIERYRVAATAEGAITGAGGILLGLADLPLWLSIKIKMLTHLSALYGFDTGDVRERIFLLHVLSLAFSSRQYRRKVYRLVEHWDAYAATLPADAGAFDWRAFQQEYRDFLDIAKLLQLIPGIGAAVGAVVNNRLTDRLGDTAMNAFRMRLYGKPTSEMPLFEKG